jgi:hypothetical protein
MLGDPLDNIITNSEVPFSRTKIPHLRCVLTINRGGAKQVFWLCSDAGDGGEGDKEEGTGP